MALWNALSWSGANSALRIALGFFSAKVSAVYLGPSGMALVGEINNFLQVSTGAVANGAQTGVVNLTAERKQDADRLPQLWATAVWSVLVMGGLVGLLVLTNASRLSSWLLFDAKYWPVVVAAAFVVVFAVVDTVLVGALNGLKQVKLVATASMASTIVEFALFAGLTYTFGIWGGLFAITAIYGSKLIVSSWIAFQSKLISPRVLFGAFDRQTLREIWKFYPMLLAHSIALPLAMILVRSTTVRAFGLEAGGYLQAVWRLSDMYVGVVTTALGLYFMAYFSSLTSDGERAHMLRRTLLQLAVITICCASAIYLLRDVIIAVVLTASFAPIRDLLPLQLVGDVFKVVDYPLQMVLVTQRRVGSYIAQAVGGPALYVALNMFWAPSLGAQAAPAAYATSYFVVMVALLLVLRRTLAARRDELTPVQQMQTA
jgi:PST family polysaccharide transporter